MFGTLRVYLALNILLIKLEVDISHYAVAAGKGTARCVLARRPSSKVCVVCGTFSACAIRSRTPSAAEK